MKNTEVKIINAAMALGFALTVLISLAGFGRQVEGIRDSVLRLHILANSDSEEDQALKLAVRDRLLEEGVEVFDRPLSKNETEALAREHSERFCSAALEVIRAAGFDYGVDIVIGETYFDERTYGNLTLPAGVYNAVNVYIGAAEGHNWWCVMFPPMCLPAAEGSKELDGVLDDGQMDIVKNSGKYEIRLKTLEIIENIKNRISGRAS